VQDYLGANTASKAGLELIKRSRRIRFQDESTMNISRIQSESSIKIARIQSEVKKTLSRL
jgi:hypothetical protein